MTSWRSSLDDLLRYRPGEKVSLSRLMLIAGWAVATIYTARILERALQLPDEQFSIAIAYTSAIVGEIFVFSGGVYAWSKHLDAKNGYHNPPADGQ